MTLIESKVGRKAVAAIAETDEDQQVMQDIIEYLVSRSTLIGRRFVARGAFYAFEFFQKHDKELRETVGMSFNIIMVTPNTYNRLPEDLKRDHRVVLITRVPVRELKAHPDKVIYVDGLSLDQVCDRIIDEDLFELTA